jgi:hypothetical protein
VQRWSPTSKQSRPTWTAYSAACVSPAQASRKITVSTITRSSNSPGSYAAKVPASSVTASRPTVRTIWCLSAPTYPTVTMTSRCNRQQCGARPNEVLRLSKRGSPRSPEDEPKPHKTRAIWRPTKCDDSKRRTELFLIVCPGCLSDALLLSRSNANCRIPLRMAGVTVSS